jgi:hypothetical protein
MWLAFITVAVAGENLIANGSFEEQEGTRAVHWNQGVLARTRNAGNASHVVWIDDDPSHSKVLRISADSGTVRWWDVESDLVPVAPGDQLVLSGAMRTQDVRDEAGQSPNNCIGVRFFDREGNTNGIVGTQHLLGDHPWTTVRLAVNVPDGATHARVYAFLSMSGTAWFDNLKLEPANVIPWLTASTEHYDFHWVAEAPVSEENQQANERELARLVPELGVAMPARIAYYRYASKQQKGELTGDGGNAHTDLRAIYTIWAMDDHEIVHILTEQWGKTDQALLGEGIAVHESGNWQGRPVDDYARDLLAAGKVGPLSQLTSPSVFRGEDALVTYAVAGSFVGYLVRLKDMAAFQRAYVAGAPLDARLKAEYGKDLATLDADWRASLAKR